MTSEKDEFDAPVVLEPSVYRRIWPDLAQMSDVELHTHYSAFGILEGRRANRLNDRRDFLALIPEGSSVLEIGPFCSPLLTGDCVKFFDVLSKEQLESRARGIGMIGKIAPKIDFISPDGDLSVVQESFKFVISSHCIEHQPDLIMHLQQVERILVAGGRYLLMVPDKRYCFDALIHKSTIAEVLNAHSDRRTLHTLRSVIEHRAFTTHNNSVRHWSGDHGEICNTKTRILAAKDEYTKAYGNYIDVHAWYFEPASIVEIIELLNALKFINLKVERLYPTRRHSEEFWMILHKKADSEDGFS